MRRAASRRPWPPMMRCVLACAMIGAPQVVRTIVRARRWTSAPWARGLRHLLDDPPAVRVPAGGLGWQHQPVLAHQPEDLLVVDDTIAFPAQPLGDFAVAIVHELPAQQVHHPARDRHLGDHAAVFEGREFAGLATREASARLVVVRAARELQQAHEQARRMPFLPEILHHLALEFDRTSIFF